jgi:hypothetical protein
MGHSTIDLVALVLRPAVRLHSAMRLFYSVFFAAFAEARAAYYFDRTGWNLVEWDPPDQQTNEDVDVVLRTPTNKKAHLQVKAPDLPPSNAQQIYHAAGNDTAVLRALERGVRQLPSPPSTRVDVSAGYRAALCAFDVAVQNALNTEWREARAATASLPPSETSAAACQPSTRPAPDGGNFAGWEDLHFALGAPVNVMATASFFFRPARWAPASYSRDHDRHGRLTGVQVPVAMVTTAVGTANPGR